MTSAPTPTTSVAVCGPITLRVPRHVAEQAAAAAALELVDPEGTPLAMVSVESTYDAGNLVGIQGGVAPARPDEFGAFRRLYLTPAQAR